MSHEVFQNYINGQWVGSSAVIENINPSDTSDVVGHYAKATSEDCLAAIAAANSAFASWSQSGLEQRKQVLDFIGAELIARSAEIGEILAREEGKTRAEGVGEVYRSGQFFQYYGAETLRLMGENTQSVRPGVDVDVDDLPRLSASGVGIPFNKAVHVQSLRGCDI